MALRSREGQRLRALYYRQTSFIDPTDGVFGAIVSGQTSDNRQLSCTRLDALSTVDVPVVDFGRTADDSTVFLYGNSVSSRRRIRSAADAEPTAGFGAAGFSAGVAAVLASGFASALASGFVAAGFFSAVEC